MWKDGGRVRAGKKREKGITSFAIAKQVCVSMCSAAAPCKSTQAKRLFVFVADDQEKVRKVEFSALTLTFPTRRASLVASSKRGDRRTRD